MQKPSRVVIFIVVAWVIFCWPMVMLWSGVGGIFDVFHVLQNSYVPEIVSIYFAQSAAFILPLYFASTRAQTRTQAYIVIGIGCVVILLQIFLDYIGTLFEHLDCGDDCIPTIIPLSLVNFITLSLIPLLGGYLLFASVKMLSRIKAEEMAKVQLSEQSSTELNEHQSDHQDDPTGNN